MRGLVTSNCWDSSIVLRFVLIINTCIYYSNAPYPTKQSLNSKPTTFNKKSKPFFPFLFLLPYFLRGVEQRADVLGGVAARSERRRRGRWKVQKVIKKERKRIMIYFNRKKSRQTFLLKRGRGNEKGKWGVNKECFHVMFVHVGSMLRYPEAERRKSKREKVF